MKKPRQASISRQTLETNIQINVSLDGSGTHSVETRIGFLDHMLGSLAKHARMDLELTCDGDLQVDDHHTAEDCALALGAAFDKALAERRGIQRFGYAYAPLDESLARAVVDLSGRPHAEIHIDFVREKIGDLATENIMHVFHSFAMAARATIHVDVIRGKNDHHKAEAACKSLALALQQAVSLSGSEDIPSTKGVL